MSYVLTKDDINNLKEKKLFLFDMDGTIYNDDKLFPGVLDLMDNIKKSGGRYVFLTNNSSKSVQVYIERLTKMGIEVDEDNFFTSTQATILYLKNVCHYQNELIYALGTNAFKEELKKQNLNITDVYSDDVKILLVGYDTELDYQKLIDASKLLTKDVLYIATNPDLVCPTSFGFVPDCGSMCYMLYNASKKNPTYIGKPKPEMIKTVLQKFNLQEKDALLIGDRLYTDIASGLNANVDTVCVLTGEATLDDLQVTEFKPKYILDSVDCLNEIFK